MQTIRIPTTQNIELEYPIASVGHRVGAFFADLSIILGYLYFLGRLNIEFLDSTWIILSMPILTYSLWTEAFFGGQTFGKYLLRIRVVRLDGMPPSLGDYLLRWMLRLVDVWVSNGIVSVAAISMTTNGQRLGDLAAGTTVVRLKLVYSFGDTIFRDTGDDYELRYPEISKLSDKDMAILKEILDYSQHNRSPELLYRLKDKIVKVTGIETRESPAEFVETLFRDYNHFFGQSK